MFEMLIGKSSNVVEGPPGVKFIGEQPVAGFIDGEELASRISLTAGIAQFSDEPWLHFILDGVELYVAKKPYRCRVSWDQINNAGAVTGSRRVIINGHTYKVRLLRTKASGDKFYMGIMDSYDPTLAYGSEWNRLFYPIHSGEHTKPRNPSSVSGEGIRFGTLAQYTDTDLVFDPDAGNGADSWCQEVPYGQPVHNITRGSYGVSYINGTSRSEGRAHVGWRPVLELVG